MKPISFLVIVVTCFFAMDRETVATRPNVIVILTDDQGWGDLSLHGNPNLQTPNIDAMARQGAQLENFYVCPVCSPTRAEFLTGRYHTRMGVYSTSAGGERFDLGERTIGDFFSTAGYATAAYGKWHSGMQPPYHPNARGFDDFYGFCSGHWGNYFSPMLEHNGQITKGDGFIIDDLTNHAIDFITQRHADDKPFFVYLPLNTPHSPMAVPDEKWAEFAERPITPDPTPANAKGSNIDHTRAALALCENIDDNVGRLLMTLDTHHIAQETIVVYFCDNGPNGKRFNGGMRGRKGSVHEGGVRSPCFIRYPDAIRENLQIKSITGAIDLLPTLAELCQIDITNTKGPLDGQSIADQLTGHAPVDGSQAPTRLLFTHWNGKASVRSQRWRYSIDGRLSDIQADRVEQNDVAKQFPGVAKRLQRQLDGWLSETEPIDRRTASTRPFPVGHPDFALTTLPARDGIAEGSIRRSNRFPNCTYFFDWTSEQDAILFDVDVLEAGTFDITMFYGAAPSAIGTTIEVTGFNDDGVELTSTSSTIEIATPREFLNVSQDRVARQEGHVRQWRDISLGSIPLPAGPGTLRMTAPVVHGSGVEMRLLVLERRAPETTSP
ncbi:MAG: arylsulfatase [Planctomycetota bacterium]